MAKVFLLTGLSGAGKTTLAAALAKELGKNACVMLDGDEMRKGVCSDLGFSPEDRRENIRRCGEIAKALADQDFTVVLSFIAPYENLRENLKQIIGAERFYTIHLDCPLEVCISRDPKKNYKLVSEGKIKNYTGIGDAYECPAAPDLVIHTASETEEKSLAKLLKFVREKLKTDKA